MSRDYGQTCFVDMPFGKKTDPNTGLEIDFDQIYAKAVRPAVEAAGLQCIRGDKEDSGGIIHKAMFARLLLCDFVVADLTTANANVFYELGVRHAARPYTTIPIYAPLSDLPFDVAMVRTIPYKLIGAGSTAKRKTREEGQANRQAHAGSRAGPEEGHLGQNRGRAPRARQARQPAVSALPWENPDDGAQPRGH